MPNAEQESRNHKRQLIQFSRCRIMGATLFGGSRPGFLVRTLQFLLGGIDWIASLMIGGQEYRSSQFKFACAIMGSLSR